MSTAVDRSPSSTVAARTIGEGWVANAGRLGWVAKGVVYVLVGITALPIALSGGRGGGGEEASRSGALARLADNSFGGVLLLIVGVGLALYSLWRLTTAFLPGDGDAETWGRRVAYLFSAALYGFLAYTAFEIALGSSGGASNGGGSRIERISRALLESTGGRWLLGSAGLVMIGVAIGFVVKAVQRDFLERIALADASDAERTAVRKLGVVGWIGRGVTLALLAVFVLQAALTADPSDANGLDTALRETAGYWWGAVLVLIAGIGLVAYGAFAIVSARHRRLLGP